MPKRARIGVEMAPGDEIVVTREPGVNIPVDFNWGCDRRPEDRIAAAAAAIERLVVATSTTSHLAHTYSTKALLDAYRDERKGRKRKQGTLDFITKHSKT